MKKHSVLLISGWAHGVEAMQPLAEAVADLHRVTSLSLADIGGSRGEQAEISTYAREIARCLDNSGEPACIVGWSTGGIAAIEAAANYPEKVSGLVLLGAAARFCSTRSGKSARPLLRSAGVLQENSVLEEEYTAGVDASVLKLMIRGVKRDPQAVIGDFLVRALHPMTVPEDELARRTRVAIEQGTDSLIDGLEYLARVDLRRVLPAVTIPCLIFHGRQDKIIPWHAAQYLASNLPRSKVEFLPSAGHSLIEQCGKDLRDRVAQFVESLTRNCVQVRAGYPTAAPGGSISARFAAAAQTYHEESGLQRKVAEKLAAAMPPLEEIDRVLEVGCGTGFLTELITKRFPRAWIDAVDIAPAMIDLARERIGKGGRIRWYAMDARQFCPDADFPLIVSSSALHWMSPVSCTIKRLAGMLGPGGCLVSALMVKGTLDELHAARTRLFPAKPAPSCLPDAEEVLADVEAAGLRVLNSREELFRQTHCCAHAFFRSLNRQGVTASVNNGPRLLNRTELQSLIEYYDRQFAVPVGGVFATYRVLYVTARKDR